jgi:hypothetical protein
VEFLFVLGFALVLNPPAFEASAPARIEFKLSDTNLIHTRWKSSTTQGEWLAPRLVLSQPGKYWISAGTKSRVKRYTPSDFEVLSLRQSLDLIAEYRKKYKLAAQPVRILENEFAKTLLHVGPRKADEPSQILNLPIEFDLRYPTLLQLNFRGAPIAGIPVLVNGKRLGVTNGAGQIPIAGLDGKLEISASVVRAYPDHTTADWEVFTATLTLPELSLR